MKEVATCTSVCGEMCHAELQLEDERWLRKVMSAYCGGHDKLVDIKAMTLRHLETSRALTSYHVDDNIVIDVFH
jgi:hypothetical protein